MVKFHNIKFYKPDSRAIYCVTLQKDKLKLALSRSDSTIEIWNLQNLPYIEQTIPNITNYNIEDLIWSKNRLFSCTLQCFLYEYNLFNLAVKQKESLIGEAAFCLDCNKTNSNIVVGTQNGYLNIFSIEDEIKYLKFLDKQDGRILCVKYDYTGNFIVSGSIDVIRIWDVNNGHALHKMTTGRSEMHKSTIVWCLQVTSDFTIISGDSRGKLTFWDGKIGSQIESYQSHKADILSLTLSEDENMLFCAGVDPTLTCYVKINVKEKNKKWVKSIQRKAHDHDVRALVLLNNRLYSAGIDGYLACTYHPPKTLIKYPPLLQNNCVTISKYSKYVQLQYSSHIEVWQLGTISENITDKETFPLKNSVKKLLHLEHVVKDDANESYKETIMCSSISSNGEWIVYSTPTTLKLYNFLYNNIEKPQIKPIKSLPKECDISARLTFTKDDKELILALCSGSVVIVDLETITFKQEIYTDTIFTDTVSHLVVSSDGKYLIATDISSNIAIWIKKSVQWKYYFKLPKYSCSPTAVAVQPDTNILWIAYSDLNLVEYLLEDKIFSKFSNTLNPQRIRTYANKHFPIRNITFEESDSNVVLLHDDTNIIIINRNKKSRNSESVAKVPKISANDSLTKKQGNFLSCYKKYQHLLHLESLSKDEIVAVEVAPLQLMEQLPPCLKQTTFGTK